MPEEPTLSPTTKVAVRCVTAAQGGQPAVFDLRFPNAQGTSAYDGVPYMDALRLLDASIGPGLMGVLNAATRAVGEWNEFS